MAHSAFVHLRTHSAYSLSEGAMHVKDIAKQCLGFGMPAVAVTDTNNMFGALEVSEILRKSGIQPIIGLLLAVQNPYAEISRGGRVPEPDWVPLLAQTDAGYRNLMRLVSKAHIETDSGETPHVTFEDFRNASDGLICLSGGPKGPVGRLLLEGKADKAELVLEALKSLFPDRLYIEIMRHGLPEEDESEEAFLSLAYAHDLPLVATNDTFFTDIGMYEAHDALLCIASQSYVAQTDRRRLTPEHRFKSPEEMVKLFDDLPEAIANSLVIAERCAFKVEPIDPILPNFTQGLDQSEEDMLKEQSERGLKHRLQKHVFGADDDDEKRAEKAKPYLERLDYELGIINEMGFPGYFLIVADFIEWTKDQGIPVGPGRGSGAGSIVAWALNITDLDPLRFSLLFERFLNPERVSMPDFDIDFCQERRDEVIHYVQDKYGHDQVAQIITFGKLQARAVLRDVGRVMQMPYGQVDRLSKLVPNNPADPVTLKQAIEQEPRLQYEIDNDELTKAVIDRALKLEGLFRHASTHAAGVVIGDRPLDQLVPLYRDPRSDMPVTQFNMKWVEQAGLVKFDFLGLKTLTVLSRACRYLKRRDIEVDLSTIPLDDPKTFELLKEGGTAGVFQLESTGMRSVLKGLKPDVFEDIIALVALYRPGPMDNIPTYVSRKHGLEEPDYMHPLLEPVLKETYGVIIYQEQVMQIAQILADYSLGEADLLRRAMGKKKKEDMDKQRQRFLDGAGKNGVDKKQANYIFDLVAKFAGYGFNKSHAACYALVAYQTAYLKANYPVEFMAALMSLDMHNTDKLSDFKKELQRLDIPILLPDINKSEVEFSVEETDVDGETRLGVRYALAAVKNVGEKAMESVVATREADGPYKDVFDFAERLDPKSVNKRAFENLTFGGAFDKILPNRAQLADSVELLLRHAHSAADDRASDQESLFAMTGEEAARPALPDTPPWPDTEVLARENAAIGFYLSAHPLDNYAAVLERHRVVPSNEILADDSLAGKIIRLAGAIDGYQERKSRKNGKPYAYLRLSDSYGGFEVLVFSSFIDSARMLVEDGGPIVVTAKVEIRDEDGSMSLLAEGLQSLDALAAGSDTGLVIELADDRPLAGIRTVLERSKGGKGRVSVNVSVDGGAREITIDLPGGHKITPPVRSAIASLPGVVEAREL